MSQNIFAYSFFFKRSKHFFLEKKTFFVLRKSVKFINVHKLIAFMEYLLGINDAGLYAC